MITYDNPQVVTRLSDKCFDPAQRAKLLNHILSPPHSHIFSDPTLKLIGTLLRKIPATFNLNQETNLSDNFIQSLEFLLLSTSGAEQVKMRKSMLLSTCVLSFVTQHSKVALQHKEALATLVSHLTSFLKKSILSSLNKLK